MNVVRNLKQRKSLLAFGLLALGLGLAGVAGGAQQTEKQQGKPKAQTKSAVKQGVKQPVDQKQAAASEQDGIHIYAARNVAADQLATMITSIFGESVRLTVDERGNRLVVATYATPWERIELLLQQLDVKVAAAEGEGQHLVTLSLNGVADDERWFQNTLNMLIPKNSNAKFTIDSSKNLLLLYADEKTVDMVRALCETLKSASENTKKLAAAKPPEAQPLQIRLLWLMDTGKQEAAEAPLAGEFEKIIPVLSRLGINHPRIVSNCLVNSTMGGVFKSFGTTHLGSGPARIDLDGRTRLVGNIPNLTINLRIGTDAPKVKDGVELASVQTDIQAPIGHFVILGMTPVQTGTSIFVIQLSEPE